MPIIFCNIGWMEHYQGQRKGDHISGGGSYVKKEGRGHEVCNFYPDKEKLYGYVQPTGDEIKLERMGGTEDDDYLEGVTVVWTAKRPTGGTTIVGWYNNATVYRHYKRLTPSKRHRKNGVDGYRVMAQFANARLLPVDERVFDLPRGVKGSIGQSNVWYADSPESAERVRRVRAYIDNGPERQIRPQTLPRAQDQNRKVQVEQAAISACCQHFEELGYLVTSVEKDNLGWDLEAVTGRVKLRIEVKGLSGPSLIVELTPNEYRAFESNERDYRLAVVVSALDNPSLIICRYSDEAQEWVAEGGQNGVLDIKIKTSAQIVLK